MVDEDGAERLEEYPLVPPSLIPPPVEPLRETALPRGSDPPRDSAPPRASEPPRDSEPLRETAEPVLSPPAGRPSCARVGATLKATAVAVAATMPMENLSRMMNSSRPAARC